MNANPGTDDYLTIGLSLLVVMILSSTPCPKLFDSFQPAWLPLLLIYWVIAPSGRVGIGCGFALGIIWDLITGTTLGSHALALSLLAYGVARHAHLLRNLSLWQQAVLVVPLTLAVHIVIFLSEYSIANTRFHPEIFGSSLANGLLWPCLLLMLRKIHRR